MIFDMLFLIFSNVDIEFAEKKLSEKSYITAKALPTIKQVEFIDMKKFAKMILDKDSKIFIIYIAALEVVLAEIIIHSL